MELRKKRKRKSETTLGGVLLGGGLALINAYVLWSIISHKLKK